MIERIDNKPEESTESTEVAIVKKDEQAVATRLEQPVKLKVLAMLARGERGSVIRRILQDEHNVEYSQQALSELKKNNRDIIAQMQAMMLDKEVSEADQVRGLAMRQLRKKLERATDDELALDALDEEYRNTPTMSLAEYRRRKAGLLKMTVTELLMISKEMHAQAGKPKGASIPNGGGAGTSQEGEPADPAMAEALLSAIQRGDTITLQQMIVKPNA